MKLLKLDFQAMIICLAALYSLAFGGYQALHNYGLYDFVPEYCEARCLLYGCNPYDPAQLRQQYLQAGGHANQLLKQNAFPAVYPPSTHVALSPLALVKFPVARLLWLILNGALFVLSVALVLSLCQPPHRWLATILASLFLLNGAELLQRGQPAAIAISSLVIGSVLFLRGRYLLLAACLLMLSLAVKPQIGALLVLYFLVKKGCRRYAAVAAIGALILLFLGGWILQTRPQSANWISDMRANIAESVQPGHVNDLALSTSGQINIQSLTGIVFANARLSDAISIGIFAALLAAWGLGIPRVDSESTSSILMLGALSVLSLIPVYHRFYDTFLLVLTIPAILLIFEKRRSIGVLIAAVTVIANAYTGRLVNGWLQKHATAVYQYIIGHKILFILFLRYQSVALLLLACLYIVAIFTIWKPSGIASQPSQPVLSESR